MIFEEYRKLTTRTLSQLGSIELDLSHMGLGLATEYFELQTAKLNKDMVNYAEEIGDKLWYLANMCNILELPAIKVTPDTESHMNLEEILDTIKKFMAYGKGIDFAKMKGEVEIYLNYLNTITMNHTNTTLGNIMEANINKLKKRYPEKFEQDLALNRDTDAERKQLEIDL